MSKDDSLQFSCPQCMARLKVSPALAGKRRRCPRCQLMLEVPRQSPAKPQEEDYPLSAETGPQPAAARPPTDLPKLAAAPPDDEGYALRDEASPTANDRGVPPSPLIRITCPVCRTLMYAAEDQIGRQIVCPDCHVSTMVRRPADDPAMIRRRAAVETGDYGLADGGIFPSPPPMRRKAEPMAGAGEDYHVVGWDETSPRRSGPQDRAPPPATAMRRAAKPAEEKSDSSGEHPVLPRRPFLTGTFTFPFSRSARAVSFVLAAWAILPFWLLQKSMQLASVASEVNWIGSMLLGGVAMTLVGMWFAFASACALTVVRDTANGSDEIHNWPDMGFLDWMFDPLYIFNSVCVSQLPAIGVAWCRARSLQPDPMEVAGGLLVLFPIALMSMLERNSPLGAVSLPVYRSFWMARKGWAAFYLATAILFSAAGYPLFMVYSAVKVYSAGLLEIIGGTLILGLVWLIYFRLMGRLAWYCAEYTIHVEPEAAE